MKTILCPIDFSEAATNALLYASDLAIKSGATLHLFHSYYFPYIIPYSGFYLQPEMNHPYESEVIDKMEHLINWLNKVNAPARLQARCTVRCGATTDEIVALASEIKADLIVMGTEGAESLTRVMLSTHSAKVIATTGCPVLVIPVTAHYQDIKNIVYATELDEAEENQVHFVANLAKLYKATLSFLHVEKEEMAAVHEDTVQRMRKMHKRFSGNNMSFYVNGNKDVQKGINTFVMQKKADMLVTVTHKRSFIEQFYDKSLSKKQVFHSRIPVLVLHK